jgi:hypothetical protein
MTAAVDKRNSFRRSPSCDRKVNFEFANIPESRAVHQPGAARAHAPASTTRGVCIYVHRISRQDPARRRERLHRADGCACRRRNRRRGASIWFGVVLRADKGSIRIGARSSIEDNAVVHAREKRIDVVGNDVTVGIARFSTTARSEDGALVGSNAVVLNGAASGRERGRGRRQRRDRRRAPSRRRSSSPAHRYECANSGGRSADWVAHSAAETVDQMLAYRRDGLGDPHAPRD